MALTTTTLAAACAATDIQISVTSATGFAANQFVLIDQEWFKVLNAYTSGTLILVLRGQNGSTVQAHASGANCITDAVSASVSSDWANAAPSVTNSYPLAGRARTVTSYSASGAITLPLAGTDAVAVLNGTTGLTMTVAAPTKDMDGCVLSVSSNGAATTTTVTFTGGLNGAGSSYDVFTLNTTGPVLIQAMAVNGAWMIPCAAAMTGTVTALVGGIA